MARATALWSFPIDAFLVGYQDLMTRTLASPADEVSHDRSQFLTCPLGTCARACLFVALPSFAQDSPPRQLPAAEQQQPMQVASTHSRRKSRPSFWWTPSSPTRKGTTSTIFAE